LAQNLEQTSALEGDEDNSPTIDDGSAIQMIDWQIAHT